MYQSSKDIPLRRIKRNSADSFRNLCDTTF